MGAMGLFLVLLVVFCGIFAPWIGSTGGRELKLANARAIPVSELKAAHESWFPRFMGN